MAKIVLAEQVRDYPWSSLDSIVKGSGKVDDLGWRAAGRFGPDDGARKACESYLIEIGADKGRREALGLSGLAKGWAIGNFGWQKDMAKEFGHLAFNPGLKREEIKELREGAWERKLELMLEALGREEADLATKPKRQDWKAGIAVRIRRESRASIAWMANR